MPPGEHADRSLRFHIIVANQPGQHTAAHLRLHPTDVHWTGLVEDRLAHGRGREAAIGDQAVEVGVVVQRGAEVMDEGHRPEAGPGRRLGASPANNWLGRPDKDAERRAQRLGPVASKPAHLVPNRHPRQHLTNRGRRGLDHPTHVAARAQAPRAAREGQQKVMPATAAANMGEAVGENAALEVLAEAALDEGGKMN